MANLNVTLASNKTLDLSKAPHTLIAGTTGSGKSVCVNAILLSLISQNTAKDLRLILVDPKIVELMPYGDLPHLLRPIITEVSKASDALSWACEEMDRRYQILASEGVRSLSSYNQKVSESDKLPSIVIVMDEFADLIHMAKKTDLEGNIIRIAQKARAVGIHLILATQRPSVNVITGILKANVPTRIAFQVASQIDSRTILDVAGAEKLLGKGDMYLKENGVNEIQRLQGVFVSDSDVEAGVSKAIAGEEGEVSFSVSKLSDSASKYLDEVIAKCDERRSRIARILAR